MQIDKTKPTVGSITISPEPTEIWIKDDQISITQTDGATPVKIFKEPPTITISVADNVSGLWKLTYKKTPMNAQGKPTARKAIKVPQ